MSFSKPATPNAYLEDARIHQALYGHLLSYYARRLSPDSPRILAVHWVTSSGKHNCVNSEDNPLLELLDPRPGDAFTDRLRRLQHELADGAGIACCALVEEYHEPDLISEDGVSRGKRGLIFDFRTPTHKGIALCPISGSQEICMQPIIWKPRS